MNPFGGGWAVHAVSKDRKSTLVLAESSGLTRCMRRLKWWALPTERNGVMLPGDWTDMDTGGHHGKQLWSFWLNPDVDIIHHSPTAPRPPFSPRSALPSRPTNRHWDIYVLPEFEANFTIEVGTLAELEWKGKPKHF